MSKKFNDELKNLSVDELVIRVDELRRDLFSLRLHSITTPLKDKSQFQKLRRNIARALTHLKLKQSVK